MVVVFELQNRVFLDYHDQTLIAIIASRTSSRTTSFDKRQEIKKYWHWCKRPYILTSRNDTWI